MSRNSLLILYNSQKLKTMLKPNQENIELKTEVRILNVHSPPVAPNDVKGYTRERNR